MENQATKVHSM